VLVEELVGDLVVVTVEEEYIEFAEDVDDD
jgi:hypothetical protein